MKWYYAVGEEACGPVERAELEALFEAGTITTGTMVTQEGMYEWVPFVNLKKTTQFLPAVGEKARTEAENSAPPAPALAQPKK